MEYSPQTSGAISDSLERLKFSLALSCPPRFLRTFNHYLLIFLQQATILNNRQKIGANEMVTHQDERILVTGSNELIGLKLVETLLC